MLESIIKTAASPWYVAFIPSRRSSSSSSFSDPPLTDTNSSSCVVCCWRFNLFPHATFSFVVASCYCVYLVVEVVVVQGTLGFGSFSDLACPFHFVRPFFENFFNFLDFVLYVIIEFLFITLFLFSFG